MKKYKEKNKKNMNKKQLNYYRTLKITLCLKDKFQKSSLIILKGRLWKTFWDDITTIRNYKKNIATAEKKHIITT